MPTSFIRLTDAAGAPALVAVEDILIITKGAAGETLIALSGFEQEMEVKEDKAAIVTALENAGYKIITP